MAYIEQNFNFDNNRLKHRGPDWSGIFQYGDFYLAHQRLAIIDPASGDQPLFNEDKKIVVTVSVSTLWLFGLFKKCCRAYVIYFENVLLLKDLTGTGRYF